MAVTYATVTKAPTGPGPVRRFSFYPQTEGNIVTVAAQNYEHAGPFEVTAGASGAFTIALPTGTDQGGATLLWKIVETPVDKIPGRAGGGLAPLTIGYSTINASIDYDDLIAGLVDATAVTPDLVSGVAANAATASAKAAEASGSAAAALDSAANADSSADLAEAARLAAEANANGFSAGTATALAPGATPTLSITGTAPSRQLNLGIPAGLADDASMEAVRANPASAFAQGLSATLVPRWKATTAYAAGAVVMAPDGGLVKAKAAFTSGATYNPLNWTPADGPRAAARTFARNLNGKAQAFQVWYSALANRDYALARVGILGDSFVEGGYATPGSALAYIDRTFARYTQQRLRELCPTAGLGSGGGIGYVPAAYSYAATFLPEPFLSGGGVGTISRGLTSVYGVQRTYVSLSNGGYAVFYYYDPATLLNTGSPAYQPFAFTGVDIITASSTDIRYSVDATGPGAATTVIAGVPGDAGKAGTIKQVRGITGTNILTLQGPATGSTNVEGVIFYNGDEAKGIQVLNFGHSGARVGDFLNPGASESHLRGLATMGVDLVTLSFGTNDCTSTSAATFKADLQQLITRVRAYYTQESVTKPSFLIATPFQRTAGTLIEPWANYVQAASEVAAEDTGGIGGVSGVHFEDLGTRIPAPNTGVLGLFNADGIHPNVYGHRVMGDALAAIIAPA